ncbi:serine protease [Ensifer sp. ENS12]|uniref:S1 family peptidase n=1 Tax=Ensifer sp. ENS12 TaxID=2854774 RepID=UPI000DE58B16|nr:serine protease [Ensifer sp. ENS12]MBV7522282.1 serine protease [Ensifer sp. ENS12]
MPIEQQSVQSLFIEMYFDQTRLSTGTAFVVSAVRGNALITNRHNVTGRRQDNNQPLSPHGGVPNKIRVWHNAATGLGNWGSIDYPLYDNNDVPLWVEHPVLGAAADFVALPIDVPDVATVYPYDLTAPQNGLLIRASDPLSIIGFPFGQAAGGLFGMWVTGFVASELDIDYDAKPIFLIDSRTRPGQSGSPVIAARRGMIHYKNGNINMGGEAVEFLGIYSGRINEQSDLGFVWKRSAIKELVDTLR